MSEKHIPIHTGAELTRSGHIKVSFWSNLMGDEGVSTYHTLPVGAARTLAERILSEIEKVPRVASAADLGIAA